MDSNQNPIGATVTRHVDRISSLPDDVITNSILSLLRTKDSVRTSALSTRWKDLYTFVPVLDFKFKVPTDSVSAFTGPVSNLLNTVTNNLSHISGFRVRFQNTRLENSVITSWIKTAVSNSVQRLDVRLSWFGMSPVPHASLTPHTIFTCETLVSLCLDLEFVLSVPDKVYLPKLKGIYLQNIVLQDDESLRRLFSSCPVLESLIVDTDKNRGNGSRVFYVSVPSLKALSLSLSNTVLELVINCPNLVSMNIDCCRVRGYTGDVIGTLKECFVRVQVSEDGFQENKLMELVKKVYNVQFLSLAWDSMQALLIPSCSLPIFENLTHLRLESYRSNGWELLPSLLASSPRLVDLDFILGFVEMEEDFCGNRFPPPEHVPVCLSSHLKVISFGRFLGEEDEYKWVEYFLANGLVLEKMEICLWWREGSEEEKDPDVKGEEEGEEQFNAADSEQHFETGKRLLNLPRSSDVCQVIIDSFDY